MSTTTNQPQQKLCFAQFLEQDVAQEGRYELVNGEIVKIQATRQYENIADFIADAFRDEVEKQNLNYRVSYKIMIRTLTSDAPEQDLDTLRPKSAEILGSQSNRNPAGLLQRS
jgi:Uma2 family endonuclease